MLDKYILYSAKDTLQVMVDYFLQNRSKGAMPLMRQGFAEHQRTTGNRETCLRIAKAYNLAKSHQKLCPAPYQVGPLWQKNLDEFCGELTSAFKHYDADKLDKMLSNFNREPFAMGVQAHCDYVNMKNKPFYKYEYLNNWFKFLDEYEALPGKEPSRGYPAAGNPSGMPYKGSIMPLDGIRFLATARHFMPLLENIENPSIVEIGGGFGAQCWAAFASTDKKLSYTIFDIPEVLAIASYFVILALPDKTVKLYGEHGTGDVYLLPNFDILEFSDYSVDMFINQSSFSEMNAAASWEYMRQIERTCKKYLFHINHNHLFTWQENGETITNVPSATLKPSEKLFKRVYTFPWYFLRLIDEKYYPEKFLTFLYERR